MTTLENYPNYSQLSAKINGPNDCVPTSIKDGVKFLTGEEIDVDAMMNEIYGPDYHGFTSARAFIPYLASHNVKLWPIDSDNAALVKALHEQIQALHPCLLTEPDPYAPLHPDWSHVLSVYAEAPGSITARDPYSTRDVTHSDAQWQSLLEFREIWALEKIQEDEIMPIDINSPEAKAFKEQDAHHWIDTGNGHVLQYALLDDYKKWGYKFLGRVWSNEYTLIPNEWVIQFYEFGARQWKHGVVSSLPLYDDGPGTDPRLVTLRKQVAAQPASQAQAILDKIKADLAGA